MGCAHSGTTSGRPSTITMTTKISVAFGLNVKLLPTTTVIFVFGRIKKKPMGSTLNQLLTGTHRFTLNLPLNWVSPVPQANYVALHMP